MMFGNGFGGIGNCLALGNGGFMHGGWGIIMMMGITALVITGAVILARKNRKSNADHSILDALKMKLVNGEITEEEYIRKKTILD